MSSSRTLLFAWDQTLDIEELSVSHFPFVEQRKASVRELNWIFIKFSTRKHKACEISNSPLHLVRAFFFADRRLSPHVKEKEYPFMNMDTRIYFPPKIHHHFLSRWGNKLALYSGCQRQTFIKIKYYWRATEISLNFPSTEVYFSKYL